MAASRRILPLFLLGIVYGASTADAQTPEAHVVGSERTAHPNRAYDLVYEVSWAGAADSFSILPLELEPVEWASFEAGPASSGVREDVNYVRQTLRITPSSTGEFEVPAVEIGYLLPKAVLPPEAQPSETEPPDPNVYPTLRVSPFQLVVRPDRTGLWVSGGLGALLLASGLPFWALYRRRRLQPISLPADPAVRTNSAREALHGAKQERLDGNYYAFYRALAAAARALDGEANGRLRDRLEARANDVGYRGVRPTDDELDGALRDVERALTERSKASPESQS